MREANVYTADTLDKRYYGTRQRENGAWVMARPVNYQAMFWWERLAVAWKVFTGKYDALKWVDQ